MQTLRTPDERFLNLPDYSFRPNYVFVDDTEGGQLRMHYVDEGDKAAPVVLMLHGEPSWSYLYRKMISLVAGAGYRVIAPDLIGFGRSDKPMERDDYTYARHVQWMLEFIDALQLNDITLVGQDWGGLIGLRLVAEHSHRFARVIAANTMLPTGDQAPPDAFLGWREFSQTNSEFSAGKLIARRVTSSNAAAIAAAYDAPFPDERYKAGARQFPLLVPITPDDPASETNRRAWASLKQFNKPFLTAFSDGDPVTSGGDVYMQSVIPGCQGQQHTIIEGAGHFLQEEAGEKLAAVIVAFLGKN